MRSSVITVLPVFALALGAYAQQTPAKVGVISVQGAIVGTKDGQKASQELETKFAPKKKDIDTRQSELGQLKDQYQKGGNLMSEDKRNQMARDIDEKQKRLERDVQDAQEELNAEQQKVLQSLGQRMMAVIEKYAKDNGYSMILDVSNPNTPVLYASSGIDITQDIISLYDKTSTNGGPASAPGAAPGTATKPTTNPGTASAVKPPPPGSR
ncbi:MAG: OmpH family outer membrane protein [Acidobacteriaceae bacterium]|nr:OmpH family outer membrane protein [Acidobacteriaceae bacterium]MBV9780926.1 OmpH family outer membrane protein [Acidobacteriaceae bacterium]